MRKYQPAVTGLLAYATYLAYCCPCKKTLSCHLPGFFGSVGAASFLVYIENYG